MNGWRRFSARVAVLAGIGMALVQVGAQAVGVYAYTTLSVGNVTVPEGDSGTSFAQFQIRLSARSHDTVTVKFATADGTAQAPGDYTATTGKVTFRPGETIRTASIPVRGDKTGEANETFSVILFDSVNAFIGDGRGTGTIRNDDPGPFISIDDVRVREGDSGFVLATFTVSLFATSETYVRVDYATTDGTARAPLDYVARSGTVVFTPGSMFRTISISVRGDTVRERNELYYVDLFNARNGRLADNRGTGLIVDDDR